MSGEGWWIIGHIRPRTCGKHFTSTSKHNKGKWGQHSYAVLELLACAAGLREPVTMVTRLRLDVALYDPAPERKAPERLLIPDLATALTLSLSA